MLPTKLTAEQGGSHVTDLVLYLEAECHCMQVSVKFVLWKD